MAIVIDPYKIVDSVELDNGLTEIADAVRQKGGTTDQLSFPHGIAQAIGSIPTGKSEMNKQISFASGTVNSTKATTVSGVQITVEKTGTYTVSWTAWRNRSSGTHGTQLYSNSSNFGPLGETAIGSEYTTWSNTYGQVVKLTNVTLTEGTQLYVKARSSGTTYITGVANLCIEQTA